MTEQNMPPTPQTSPNAQPAAQQEIRAPQQPAQVVGTSGMAITSLILGMLSLLTSFLPIINNGSFFLALLGILFAIIGLVGISKGKKTGKGVAIAGLVLGILSVIIVLATQTLYSAALEETFGIGDPLPADSSAASSEPTEGEVREAGTEAAQGSDETQETTVESTEEQASAQSEGQVEESAAESRYIATIDEAYVGTDYEGKPVIVVTYSWVNNSEEATSALIALSEKAFQNGVELEHAYIVDGVDSASWDSEVKPGSGTTFQRAYLLNDDSDVTIEVEDQWTWGDNSLLAEGAFSVK